MKRKSNWLKNLLQWGTLAAIVGFVVYGLTLGEKPADVEAYCPFGGLQALGTVSYTHLTLPTNSLV